jgi:hypothetical protein
VSAKVVRLGEAVGCLGSSGAGPRCEAYYGEGFKVGNVREMFPGDENRPRQMQRRLNFNVQSPEDRRAWAKVQRVILLYSDLYKKEHASELIPNPKPKIKAHHKKKLRGMVDEFGLLTCLMFVSRFWKRDDVSNEYETVKWAENRNIGAFVSDAANEELKSDWKIKSANIPKVNRIFSDYLEGFDDA